MRPETLVCSANIPPDQLNALRDGGLTAAETQRLRAHVATCAACQARLADYDRVAEALRAQRELQPGERIITGLRAQIAHPRQVRAFGWRFAPRMSGGTRTAMAAVGAVAALILLFVTVFWQLHLRNPGGGISKATATASATSLKGPTETPSTVQIPQFTHAVDATTYWGSGYTTPVVSASFSPVGTVEFIPEAMSSDLTTIAGVTFDTSGNETAQLTIYQPATKTMTKLSPTWHGYAQHPWGGVLAIDSRFIVYDYNDQPGGTCGVCNGTLWSYDRGTGKTWRVNAFANDMGELNAFVSNDHVAFTTANNVVYEADLAAHTVTPILISDTNARLLNFMWPNVMYSGSIPNTLYMQNVTTGTVTTISAQLTDLNNQLVDSSQASDMLLVNNVLYVEVGVQLNGVDKTGASVNLTYTMLFRLDAPFDSGTYALLAAWQDVAPDNSDALVNGMNANGNLIWLGSGYFWDISQSQFITSTRTNATLSGQYLVTFTNQTSPTFLAAYAYDTTRFANP